MTSHLQKRKAKKEEKWKRVKRTNKQTGQKKKQKKKKKLQKEDNKQKGNEEKMKTYVSNVLITQGKNWFNNSNIAVIVISSLEDKPMGTVKLSVNLLLHIVNWFHR